MRVGSLHRDTEYESGRNSWDLFDESRIPEFGIAAARPWSRNGVKRGNGSDPEYCNAFRTTGAAGPESQSCENFAVSGQPDAEFSHSSQAVSPASTAS
jgi:hypothetical protein